MRPLSGRTWAAIIPAAIPQFRHSIPVSTLSKQTHSSRHWFSHSGWDPVAVISVKPSLSFFTSGLLFGSGESPGDLVPFPTYLIYPPRVGAPGSVPAPSPS